MEGLLGDADTAEREVGQAGEGRRETDGPEGAVVDVQHAETAEAECGGRHPMKMVGCVGGVEDEFLQRIKHREGEPMLVSKTLGF